MNRYEGVPGVVYPKKREAVLDGVPEGYVSTAELAGGWVVTELHDAEGGAR